LVLGAVLGVVLAKTVVPRTYVARTVMVWEPEGEPDVRELRTLIDSVKLPTNLAEVRRRLSITATLSQLSGRIDVGFDSNSNLVTVAASAGEAEDAMVLADTAVDQFLRHQSELEAERVSEEVDDLEAGVAVARLNLREAQNRYDAFRRERGISDLSSERQQAIELAANLRAQANMTSSEPVRRTVAVAALTSPRLDEAQRQLALARSRLSEEHPRVLTLSAEVRVLEAELAAEGATSNAASPEDRVAARQRSTERRQRRMEELAREAEERLGELTDVEGEASSLLASVQVAESHVLDVETELARAEHDARDPSPGFRVVAPAQRPELPESSLRKPAAVAIPAAVLLLAILIILAIELWGLRGHTANEVAYWTQTPVVGATTWPRRQSLNELIDELSEHAVDSHGMTFVVSATPESREYAEKIVARLTLAVELGGMTGDVLYHDVEGVSVSAESKSSSAATSTALSRRRGDEALVEDAPASIQLWEGSEEGPALRRAARQADRVLAIVPSGEISFGKLAEFRGRLGRADAGIACLVVNLNDSLASLPDRVGPVEGFWSQRN